MSQQSLVLENLRDAVANGYLIFTDAVETGDYRDGVIFMTQDTKPGIDQALMNVGFEFEGNGNPASGMYWMKKKEGLGLRYHPIKDKDMPLIKTAIVRGMKTRIDFFCHEKSDVVFDVVSELLRLKYRVLLSDPHHRVIEEVFLIESGTDGGVKINKV